VRSVLVDRDSVLDALSNAKTPALVVSGKEDTILPSPHSNRIANKLPKARHVQVAGAAHLVPLESPEVSNTLILDFVKDLERSYTARDEQSHIRSKTRLQDLAPCIGQKDHLGAETRGPGSSFTNV
jgi:TAP-like protein